MLFVDKEAVVYSPSHNAGGKVTRPHMQQQFEKDIRKVNGVEMTWPFFRRDFLDSYLYNEYEICLLGYGEGRLYSNKANKENKNLYVVDKFSSVNPTDSQKYAIQYHGIKLNEKIKSGDIRKIVLTFRSIDNPKSVVLDEVYYNIYIMEGHTKVIVHDWTLLDKTNENSFLLDTSYLIPREYTMEFKTIVNSEELQYKEPIRFEIVSVK